MEQPRALGSNCNTTPLHLQLLQPLLHLKWHTHQAKPQMALTQNQQRDLLHTITKIFCRFHANMGRTRKHSDATLLHKRRTNGINIIPDTSPQRPTNRPPTRPRAYHTFSQSSTTLNTPLMWETRLFNTQHTDNGEGDSYGRHIKIIQCGTNPLITPHQMKRATLVKPFKQLINPHQQHLPYYNSNPG